MSSTYRTSSVGRVPNLDRSPNTVRTYASSLMLWCEYLHLVGVAFDAATVEQVSRFVAWLRAPAANVVALDNGTGRCAPATVNRHLSAVFSFYDFHARNGVAVAEQLVA